MTLPGRSYRASSAAGSVYKRRPRHASVPLRSSRCEDCGIALVKTHFYVYYGNRCKRCFDALNGGTLSK